MKNVIFGLIGGLGLFLFGMKYLSIGLQNIASNKLKFIISKTIKNPFIGVLLGVFTTSIIQSSSVTIAFLIGFINSGIMTFMQSINVVLGANIGTTITAQIIAFNIFEYTYLMIAIGILLMFISKKDKINFLGQIIFSVGIIFLGLKIMADISTPLKNSQNIMKFFYILNNNNIFGFLFGLVFTIIIQSSSAALGILIAFVPVGLIDFNTSFYIVLGSNVGTTFTAWLASIGGKTAAKRLAAFHSLFNLIGAFYFSFFIMTGFYQKFIIFITSKTFSTSEIPRYIANAHTFFNLINVIIFFPFMKYIAKFIEKIIPEKEEDYLFNSIKYLQNNLLSNPEIAFESAKKEITEMSKMSIEILEITFDAFLKKDIKLINKVYNKENEIDKLQHDITLYLSKIVNLMSSDISHSLPVLIHSINDIERISDHAVNIAEISEKIINGNIPFSNEAIVDLKKVFNIITKMANEANKIFEFFSFNSFIDIDRIKLLLSLEKELNKLHKEFFESQTQRIVELKCKPQSSLLFIDIINNLEKIGDHLKNIAQAAGKNFKLSDGKFHI